MSNSFDEQLLPITGRTLFKEIFVYCCEEMLHDDFFNAAKANNHGDVLNILKEFPWHLESGLTSLMEVVLKLENLNSDKHLKKITSVIDGQATTDNKSFEKLTLNEIKGMFDRLGYGKMGIANISEGQSRMTLAFVLMYSIGELALTEKNLINELNGDYHLVAKQLDLEISEIVNMYLRLKITPVVTKYMAKVINEKTANSGKGRTKPGKEKLFESFIDWALGLPEDHNYKYPIYAARHYHKILKESGNKELMELAKQIQIEGKTPRNMCEKLDEYCKDKNIQNPLKLPSN